MTKNHSLLTGPLLVSLIAIAFCVWTAMGNDVNICVTTGCTLYQDFSIAGISLWWYGTSAFTLLAIFALLGGASPGRFFSSLFLAGDCCLLVLMSLTAPCINCLIVAILFLLSYLFFRGATPKAAGKSRWAPLLVAVWSIFFIINIGLVARSQLDVWPILDESGEPRARMFFSPSCAHCVEGIKALSGNVNMAFYPVAENENDVHRLFRMTHLLKEGMSLAQALGKSSEIKDEDFFSYLNPQLLLLRFRLLRNKAHVFSSGSQGVPFYEYKGNPPEVAQKAARQTDVSVSALPPVSNQAPGEKSTYKDESLPFEIEEQCIAGRPCAPAN